LFPEPIEKALYDLPVGGHSRPIELEFGYHLVKLLEKRQVAPQPFEKMRESLRRRLTVLAQNELVEEFISKLVARKHMRVNANLMPALSRMYLRDHTTDERRLDAARVPEVNLEETLISWEGGEWKLGEMIEYYTTADKTNKIPVHQVEDVAAIARNALLNDFMYAYALRKSMDKTDEFKRYYSQVRRQIVARECRKILINEQVAVSEGEIRREYDRSEDLRAQHYEVVRNSIEDILLRQKSVVFAGNVIRQLREHHHVEFNDELISETAAHLDKL
jgi:parvulin-like peptidyl-prolyl isomerase